MKRDEWTQLANMLAKPRTESENIPVPGSLPFVVSPSASGEGSEKTAIQSARTAIQQVAELIRPQLSSNAVLPAAAEALRIAFPVSQPQASNPGAANLRIENIAAAQASTEAVARVSREEAVRPPKAQTTTTAKNDESTASTVLKTVGLVTGVGPIVAGLMKLFGGSDSKPVLPALTPYSMPSSLSVDAGLSADRSITSIGYSQSGQARPETNAPAKQAAQTQSPIQITVQAMDSRSFMDHSDEIARAVRNAMLRSHSINDVVSEI